MHMELGESVKTQWYEISLARVEDISQYRRIDYMVIIICIKIIFREVYSYIMVLLYSGKNSTASRISGVENFQSTDRPILFCYIIWTQNSNIM